MECCTPDVYSVEISLLADWQWQKYYNTFINKNKDKLKLHYVAMAIGSFSVFNNILYRWKLSKLFTIAISARVKNLATTFDAFILLILTTF